MLEMQPSSNELLSQIFSAILNLDLKEVDYLMKSPSMTIPILEEALAVVIAQEASIEDEDEEVNTILKLRAISEMVQLSIEKLRKFAPKLTSEKPFTFESSTEKKHSQEEISAFYAIVEQAKTKQFDEALRSFTQNHVVLEEALKRAKANINIDHTDMGTIIRKLEAALLRLGIPSAPTGPQKLLDPTDLYQAVGSGNEKEVMELLKNPYFFAQTPVIREAWKLAKYKNSPYNPKYAAIEKLLNDCLENLSKKEMLKLIAQDAGSELNDRIKKDDSESSMNNDKSSHQPLMDNLISKIKGNPPIKTLSEARQILKFFQKWLAEQFYAQKTGWIRVGQRSRDKIFGPPKDRSLMKDKLIVKSNGQLHLETEHLPLKVNAPGSLPSDTWQLYVRNRYHTAWRYLQETNPWMSTHPEWSESRHGYADINNQDVIRLAYFFQAAEFLQFPFGLFNNKDQYLEGLVDTVVTLNRAHNMDKYKNQDKDDMDGDNPTCPMGVNSRLNRFLEQCYNILPVDPKTIYNLFESHYHKPLFDTINEFLADLSSDQINDIIEGHKSFSAECLNDLELLDEKFVLAKKLIEKLQISLDSPSLEQGILAECWKLFGYEATQNHVFIWRNQRLTIEKMLDTLKTEAFTELYNKIQTILEQARAKAKDKDKKEKQEEITTDKDLTSKPQTKPADQKQLAERAAGNAEQKSRAEQAQGIKPKNKAELFLDKLREKAVQQAREAEQKRLAEQQAAREAEQKRLVEQQAREAEQKRRVEQEKREQEQNDVLMAQRLAMQFDRELAQEEREERRRAEEEMARQREQKRLADQQAAREVERKRLAEQQAREAEQKRLAEQQAAREAEQKRLAEQQAQIARDEETARLVAILGTIALAPPGDRKFNDEIARRNRDEEKRKREREAQIARDMQLAQELSRAAPRAQPVVLQAERERLARQAERLAREEQAARDQRLARELADAEYARNLAGRGRY